MFSPLYLAVQQYFYFFLCYKVRKHNSKIGKKSLVGLTPGLGSSPWKFTYLPKHSQTKQVYFVFQQIRSTIISPRINVTKKLCFNTEIWENFKYQNIKEWKLLGINSDIKNVKEMINLWQEKSFSLKCFLNILFLRFFMHS